MQNKDSPTFAYLAFSFLLDFSIVFTLSLLSFSIFRARLCHVSPRSTVVTHCRRRLANLCRLSPLSALEEYQLYLPSLVFPFLLSVPSILLTSPCLVLHRRPRCLSHFPSSPAPRLLASSNLSFSNCLLFVSLTRMSLTRHCPPAPTVAQLAWEVYRTASITSSHCRTSCLCVLRTSAPVLSGVVFAWRISRDSFMNPCAVALVTGACSMCVLPDAFTPSLCLPFLTN